NGILAERTAQPGDPPASRHCDVRLGPQSCGVATASARERHALVGRAEQEQPASGRDRKPSIAPRAGEVDDARDVEEAHPTGRESGASPGSGGRAAAATRTT